MSRLNAPRRSSVLGDRNDRRAPLSRSTRRPASRCGRQPASSHAFAGMGRKGRDMPRRNPQRTATTFRAVLAIVRPDDATRPSARHVELDRWVPYQSLHAVSASCATVGKKPEKPSRVNTSSPGRRLRAGQPQWLLHDKRSPEANRCYARILEDGTRRPSRAALARIKLKDEADRRDSPASSPQTRPGRCCAPALDGLREHAQRVRVRVRGTLSRGSLPTWCMRSTVAVVIGALLPAHL